MNAGAASAGPDFLFFWVDAIFVKKKSVAKIQRLFESLGYKSEVYKCEWVRFEESKIIVNSEEKKKKVVRDGKTKWVTTRPFPFDK